MYSWSTTFSDLFTRCRYLIVIVIPEGSYLLGWKACSSYPDAVSDYVCISSLYRIIELNWIENQKLCANQWRTKFKIVNYYMADYCWLYDPFCRGQTFVSANSFGLRKLCSLSCTKNLLFISGTNQGKKIKKKQPCGI